jgi:predicted PurR-regulated permease PerM
VIAAYWLLNQITNLIVPVMMALLIALLLLPVRNTLIRRFGMRKIPAVVTTILGSLLLLFGMLTFALRQVITSFPALANQVVIGVNEIRMWIDQSDLNVSNEQFDDAWTNIQAYITNGQTLQNIASTALGAMGTIGTVFTGGLILLFCLIFFLADGRTIWTWVVNLLPLPVREKVHQAGRRGAITLSAYIRTQILVSAIDGTGIGLGMLFFVPNFALPIGVLVFVASAIPVLGAIASGAVAALVVLVARGWVAALIMVIIVLLVQQLESHVLSPFLMGHAVSLHPVAVILAVTGGSMVAGLPGALFAVPLVAVGNTIVQYLFGNDKFPELGTSDHLPLLRRPKIEETMAQLQDSLRRVPWSRRPGSDGNAAGITGSSGVVVSTVTDDDEPGDKRWGLDLRRKPERATVGRVGASGDVRRPEPVEGSKPGRDPQSRHSGLDPESPETD